MRWRPMFGATCWHPQAESQVRQEKAPCTRRSNTMSSLPIRSRKIQMLYVAMALVVPLPALAQDAQPDKPEERTSGLPPPIERKFNFDATCVTFGFANSLFDNPTEGVPDNVIAHWVEGSVKPARS